MVKLYIQRQHFCHHGDTICHSKSGYVTTKLQGTSTCGCNNNAIFSDRVIFTFPAVVVCRPRKSDRDKALAVHAKVQTWQHCWINYFSCSRFPFCLSTVSNIMIILSKGSFYIAQYPVRCTAQSALHFCPPWQTCSFRHQLGFSGKHSSDAAITRND